VKRKEFFDRGIDIDKEADKEMLHLQYAYEQRLKEERSSLRVIQQENDEMHQKYDSLLKKIENNKSEIQKMVQEEKKLNAIIKTLEKDIAGARRELQEREDTMEDKEKRISDLKKKNKELEKFKFVLDYKIVELRKQIDPREVDIEKLQEKMQEMKTELKSYINERTAMRFIRDDLIQKLRGTERELAHQRVRTGHAHGGVEAIQKDVISLYQQVKDIKEVKRVLKKIYIKHSDEEAAPEKSEFDIMVTSPQSDHPEGGNETIGETKGKVSRRIRSDLLDEQDQDIRQRDLLEKTVNTIHRKLLKQIASREFETQKLISENVQLTRYNLNLFDIPIALIFSIFLVWFHSLKLVTSAWVFI
jgi:myosin heavy subunit